MTIFLTSFFYFGAEAQGNNPSNVPTTVSTNVSPKLVCQGDDVVFNFDIKNGTGKNYYNSPPYEYQIFLDPVGGSSSILVDTFSSSITPPEQNWATASFQRTILINKDVPAGDYNLSVKVGGHPEYENTPIGLTVNALPTISWSVPPEACYNANVTISGELTGKPPFVLKGTINGTPLSDYTINFDTTNEPYTFSIDYQMNKETVVDISSVKDDNSCVLLIQKAPRTIALKTNVWTGAEGTNWHNSNNWSCAVIPNLLTDVQIPDTANDPIISTGGPGMANGLSLATGAELQVNGQNIHIAGSISNNGIIFAETGGFLFSGTASQVFSGTGLSGPIKDLTLNNSAGLTLTGPVTVTGTVLAQVGNIQSAGNLTLNSDAVRTALIDGSGLGEVMGNVTMERYLESSYGYKYFSSPFQNSVVGDFEPYMDLVDPGSGFPHFYQYNENRTNNGSDASGWEVYNSPANALTPGMGYAVNFGTNSGVPVTVSLTGVVNNGTYTLTLQNNNGKYTKGFHLVGNPYPSPIDWNSIVRTNVDNAVYFFTSGNTDPYTGTYTSYVNGTSSDGRSSNIIPSMQGFFVKVSEPADGVYPSEGTIEFDGSSRVVDFDQEFLKKPGEEKLEKKLIRLQAGFSGVARKDALVVYFPENAAEKFESNKDAVEKFNTDKQVPSFYSITRGGDLLSINALPFLKNKRIPLGLKSEESGRMEIGIQDLKSIPETINVLLIDNKTGNVENLSSGDVYEFYISKGDFNNRFEILFSNKDQEPKERIFSRGFTTYQSGKHLFVVLKNSSGADGTLQLTNLSGQIVSRKLVDGRREIRFENISNAGVYVLTWTYKSGQYSKKVIVQKQ